MPSPTFSDKKLSVNGNIGVGLTLGAANVFATAELNSLNRRADNTKALAIYELGGGLKLPFKASIEAGWRDVSYYGATGVVAYKARDLGFPVFLEKITTKGGQVHRVRVGPYATQGEAQADAVKLKLAGLIADVRKR